MLECGRRNLGRCNPHTDAHGLFLSKVDELVKSQNFDFFSLLSIEIRSPEILFLCFLFAAISRLCCLCLSVYVCGQLKKNRSGGDLETTKA